MDERNLVIVTKIMYASPNAGICVIIMKNHGEVSVHMPLKWNNRMLNRLVGLVKI